MRKFVVIGAVAVAVWHCRDLIFKCHMFKSLCKWQVCVGDDGVCVAVTLRNNACRCDCGIEPRSGAVHYLSSMTNSPLRNRVIRAGHIRAKWASSSDDGFCT